MKAEKMSQDRDYIRVGPRVQSVREISLNYEGRTETISVRPPDVSCRGMFISIAERFPEGAVLNLGFCLPVTGAQIRTRCEVRYCLPGVGVGVEFLDITDKEEQLIEREIHSCDQRVRRKRAARKR